MTDCQANRSRYEPLVAVTGSQCAARALIHGGMRHDKCPPAGIDILKDCPFLQSGRDFKHSRTNFRLVLLDQGSGRTLRAHIRRAATECDSKTGSKIAFELSGIRIQ